MKTFSGVLIVLSAMIWLAGCGKEGGEPGPNPNSGGGETENEIRTSGVSLNKTELSLSIGGSETLMVSIVPANAANKNTTWSSSDSAVATVDAGGMVTAVKAGRATITARTADGGYTAACSVTITAGSIAVTGVTLDLTKVTVAAGDVRTFKLSIVPANATNKSVTWSSSDTAVATVDANGKMTAVKIGTTVITAITQEGGKTATCNVTVEASDPNNLLSATYIPDPVFLDYCRKHLKEWDTNNDGKLYTDEAAEVSSIDVANIYGNTIYSLTGIEYFTGITYLDCSLNNLTSLDVSECTKLEELYCNNNNRLSSLNISKHTNLEFLNCSACSLTSLDISKCTRLTDLSCYFNQLTSLDVSQCISLNYLDIEGNDLTSLDLTKNRVLKGLICTNNQLTSMDLSKCTALTSLDVDGNRLTSMDLSNNGALIYLSCDVNQLTSLDIRKNAVIESLVCNSNQLSSIAIGNNNTRLKRILTSHNRMDSSALNTIFKALPPSGSIVIHDNPGTSTCNVTLAAEKNWTVEPGK